MIDLPVKYETVLKSIPTAISSSGKERAHIYFGVNTGARKGVTTRVDKTGLIRFNINILLINTMMSLCPF